MKIIAIKAGVTANLWGPQGHELVILLGSDDGDDEVNRPPVSFALALTKYQIEAMLSLFEVEPKEPNEDKTMWDPTY